jgi:ectoine hydroxylase-related dioxygenase (phytanoyl-CoA dioxygenase family)
MRTTLFDTDLNSKLHEDGYVVVPLLSEDEVEQLRRAYEHLGVAPGDPQRACIDTFHCFDKGYKEAVHGEVESVLKPAVAPLFDRYKSLSYCYIQKWPGDTSAFGLHQDIAVVDEREAWSVEVWCALDDTNEENGQLWVVPGSHRWAPGSVRGIHSFAAPYAGLEERIIRRHAIPVPMRAGEAIIFCHATYHFSFQNRSDRFRLVAATDLIPEEARHLHWVANEHGTISEFEIDETFWVEQNPFTLRQAPATLKKVGEVDPATLPRLTDADLDRLVAEGLAIEHDPLDLPYLNDPEMKWCHRCGTNEGVEGYIDPYGGNVTLLCPRCEAAQARHAGVLGNIEGAVVEQLTEQGYTVVDLLRPDEIAEAKRLVEKLGIDPKVGFYSMNCDAPRNLAVEIDQALQLIGQSAVDRALPGYRVFKAIPVVKGPLGNNPVELHQDWEYVDERHHRGLSVWCSLDGATSQDGGMSVIPGSHRWLPAHRGSGLGDPWCEVKEEIIDRGSVEVPVVAGQAVVYDNALLHHTPPNAGDEPRVVVAFAIAPPGAPVIHIHSEDGVRAEVFEIPAGSTHFTAKPFGARPDGPPSRTIEVAVEPVTIDDVDKWLPARAVEAPDASAADEPTTAPRLAARMRRLLRR